MPRALITALVMGVFFASPSMAQLHAARGLGSQEKMLQLGIGGGVSVPVGDAKDALKNGFHLRGIVKVKPPAFPFALRGALGYQKFDLSRVPTGAEGTGNILSGLGGLTFGFAMGPMHPYVTASLGAFRVESKIDSTGTETKANQTKFGIDAGVGLDFKLSGINGFVEARLENVYTDRGFDPMLLDKKSTRIIPVTFGLMF
ncbi:MAG TPA: outer membrane beta-barrel protein [Candidatus Eisenbacteria bacterium]